MIETDPRVTGIVLAGGRSTRFRGKNKAIATVEGTTLLERVVSTLTAATGRRPVIAVRTEEQWQTYEDRLSTPADLVFDALEFEGPLAGLFAALEEVETTWTFVCGCDMPLLSEVTIKWLVTQLPPVDSVETPSDALTVAQPDGTVEPLHTLYRLTAVTETREQLSSTDGPRSVVDALDNVRVVTPETPPFHVPLRRSTTNVNSREDLSTVVRNTETSDE